jgi:SAM-dependent methyltransferase
VLDVGCGTGDVAAELATAVGPAGAVVGIDASDKMLAVATERAAARQVTVKFQVGTAEDLPFDVVRSERTLQWVADPARAAAEFARVLRPGGRVCVIDTDWRTLLPDHPSPALARRFLDAMGSVRGDQMTVGSRLVNLLRDAGFDDVQATAETHIWLEWDPDSSVSPAGLVPLRFVAADLTERGLLDAEEVDTMITQFEQSARDNRFFVSLTMFAAAATKPQK